MQSFRPLMFVGTASDVGKSILCTAFCRVFNIKGNAYRLVAKFNFDKQWIFIRFIGTHAKYDKIDASVKLSIR